MKREDADIMAGGAVHETKGSSETVRSRSYDAEKALYLDRVRALFGDYKKRGLAFAQIGPGLRVLDIGCGTGDDARLMAQAVGATGRVTGLDMDEAMIREALARIPAGSGAPLDFVAGDAYRLPFADNAFDRTRADRVFQHLATPAAALQEMIRVTRDGGWVVVLDVDWETLVLDSCDRPLTRRILNFLCDRQPSGWIGRQLYGQFRNHGLADVEVRCEAIGVTDGAVALFLWGLDRAAEMAHTAGLVSSEEAGRWLNDLREKDRQGAFFGSLAGFAVRGRKTTGPSG
jgi:ubiquinone/menaquinone biosynthesis C-methylase UbiE